MTNNSPDPVTELQSLELELFNFLSRQIANRYLIDVGSHHGSISHPFLMAGWQVDAFDPLESNRCEMASRFEGFSTLRIHPEAISGTSGVKDFYLAVRPDGSQHDFYHSLERLGNDAYHRKGEVLKIPTVSIDDLVACERIPDCVGLLKIDTEGHDLEVLKGASRLTCDVISVEFWGDGRPLGPCPSPPAAMADLLRERGYRFYIVINHSDWKTTLQYSRLELNDRDWGNIIFFHQDRFDLYEKTIHFCDRLETMGIPPINVLSVLKFACRSEMIFLDVGASHGDFTARIIMNFPGARGFLFESIAEEYSHLKTRFSSHPWVKVFNVCLSDSRNQAPVEGTRETMAPMETLDHFLRIEGCHQKVDLIRIKTQGSHLRVLRGAADTIRQNQPMILFESLYSFGGDSYYEILNFMCHEEYQLAGLYNIHLTQAGILAFADLLFVPSSVFTHWIVETPPPASFICIDPSVLLNQIKVLETACDERLALIQRLTETAEDRLKVIEILDAEVKRLSKVRRWKKDHD